MIQIPSTDRGIKSTANGTVFTAKHRFAHASGVGFQHGDWRLSLSARWLGAEFSTLLSRCSFFLLQVDLIDVWDGGIEETD